MQINGAVNGHQSTFVTVLAWIALIFGGLSAISGLLQSVLVALVMPFEPMTADEAATTPLFFRIVFEHFRAFVFGFTAFWAVTFFSALGLLRRREWARRAFVILSAGVALVTVVVGVAQQSLIAAMFEGAEAPPPDAATALLVMRVAAIILMLVFAGAFGWIALKLNTRSIRAEFARE